MIYSDPIFLLLLVFSLALYAFCRTHAGRSRVLLFSSSLFYLWAGWFDALVLALVMFLSWGAVALTMRFPRRKDAFITLGITIVLAHLLFWKYLAWIVSQVQVLFPQFLGGQHLALALPLGISFYTFQKIAYFVDLKEGEAEPVGFKDFLLFNGFFAQLIAGPITRASSLLPQLRRLQPIRLQSLHRGTLLFVLGFAKKVAIGDNLGVFVDRVLARPSDFDATTLILALMAFTSQLWADFSGYTDMGRGAALMFGIELPENFISPFLSRGPGEFWRRWHITLSQWIRDYLFIPLSMRARTRLGIWLAVFLTMLLAGLWHGAGWTFALYGLYWGALLVGEHLWRTYRQARGHRDSTPGSPRWLASVLGMYVLILFSRLLFRSPSLAHAIDYLGAVRANAGPVSFHSGLTWVSGLIVLTFLLQILGYRSLEEGSVPVWRRLAARFPSNPRGWPAYAYGAAGLALGVLLASVILGSVIFRVESLPRDFLYFRF